MPQLIAAYLYKWLGYKDTWTTGFQVKKPCVRALFFTFVASPYIRILLPPTDQKLIYEKKRKTGFQVKKPCVSNGSFNTSNNTIFEDDS